MNQRSFPALLRGVLVALACGLAGLPVIAEEAYQSIEKLMSAEEFSAAGLDRLDTAQLRALNDWLRRQSGLETEVLRTQIEAADQETEVLRSQVEAADQETEVLRSQVEQADQETETLRSQIEQVALQNKALKSDAEAEANPVFLSRIVGNFDGWTGNTVFRLENGQVWQQRLRSRYAHHGDNPEVRIEKNYMGFFKMTVVDNGRTVGVKRIR